MNHYYSGGYIFDAETKKLFCHARLQFAAINRRIAKKKRDKWVKEATERHEKDRQLVIKYNQEHPNDMFPIPPERIIVKATEPRTMEDDWRKEKKVCYSKNRRIRRAMKKN